MNLNSPFVLLVVVDGRRLLLGAWAGNEVGSWEAFSCFCPGPL